ncbi:MAG: glycosyl hydrolase, partial [Verrucomicrobia bacterium]|nr:glycosyl hydrolase [Verrucomicrobiota bacterium]
MTTNTSRDGRCAYLARCQTLLQQGERVIDALCLDQQEGESDVIAKDVFLQSEVKVIDGNIVLPSGRKYAYMVFPRDGEMLPEVAQKLKALVADGATVVSTRPKKSPSLKDYPQCEETLRKLGDEVWGSGSENRYQKGCVFSRVEDAKAKLGLKPDYTIEKASADASKVMVLHRRTSDVHIYYLSNQSEKAQNLSLSFRVSGRQPELWQAEDGTITDAPVWCEKAGRTCVDIQLKGIQTIFVMFRKEASKTEHIVSLDVIGGNAVVAMKRPGLPVLRSSTAIIAELSYSTGKRRSVELAPGPAVILSGEWSVSFVPKLGQPFNKLLPELVDFSKHDSKDVKYFSGSATYRKKIAVSGDSLKAGRLVLDLGVMNDIAQVR